MLIELYMNLLQSDLFFHSFADFSDVASGETVFAHSLSGHSFLRAPPIAKTFRIAARAVALVATRRKIAHSAFKNFTCLRKKNTFNPQAVTVSTIVVFEIVIYDFLHDSHQQKSLRLSSMTIRLKFNVLIFIFEPMAFLSPQ